MTSLRFCESHKLGILKWIAIITIVLVALSAVAALCYGEFFFPVTAPNDYSSKRCLAILSSGPERIESERALLALNNELRKRKLRFDLTLSIVPVQFSDLSSFENNNRLVTFPPIYYPTFTPRLDRFDFDFVIAIGQQALTAATDDSIFNIPKTTPLFFCNCLEVPSELSTFVCSTGVLQQRDTVATVRAGLELFPDTTGVIILSAAPVLELQREQLSLELSRFSSQKIRIQYICTNNYSTQELLRIIRRLPTTSLILFQPRPYTSKTGSFTALGLAIQNIAARPYLSTSECLLGFGSLGGFFTSYRWQAEHLVPLIEYSLENDGKKDKPIVAGYPEPFFDNDMLGINNIPSNRLPSDAWYFSLGRAYSSLDYFEATFTKYTILAGLLLGLFILAYSLYRREAALLASISYAQQCQATKNKAPAFSHSLKAELFNEVPVGFCLSSSDHIGSESPEKQQMANELVHSASQSFAKLFAISTQQLVGKRIHDVLAPAIASLLNGSFNKLFSHSIQSDITIENLTIKDSKKPQYTNRQQHFSFWQVALPNRTASRLSLTMAFDTTAIYERLSRLNEANRLWQAVLANLPGYVYVKNRSSERRYVAASDYYSQALEKPAPDLVGKQDRELFSEGKASAILAFESRIIQNNNRLDLPFKPGVNILPFPISFQQQEDIIWNGYIVEGCAASYYLCLGFHKYDLGPIRNLTELIEIYQSIADSIPVVMYVQDANQDFRFIKVNKKFFEVTGFTSSAVQGMLPSELWWPHERSGQVNASEEVAHCQELLRTGKSSQRMISFANKAGQFFEFRLVQTPIVCQNGKRYIVSFGFDVAFERNLLFSKDLLAKGIEAITLQPEHEKCLALVGEVVRKEVSCDRFVIALINEDTRNCHIAYEWSNDYCPGVTSKFPTELYNQSFELIRDYLHPDAIIAEPDMSRRTYLSSSPYFNKMRSVILTGIFADNRRLVGLVYLGYAHKAKHFSDNDITLVKAVGKLLSIVEERHRKNQVIFIGEHLLSNVVNSITLPIWLYNNEGKLIISNSAANSMVQSVLAHESREMQRTHHESVAAALTTGQSSMRQLSLANRTFLIYTQALKDSQEQICNVVKYCLEITNLLTAQKDENKHQVTMQGLLDAIPLGVIAKSIDNDYRYIICNDSFCRLVNMSSSEVIGRNNQELNILPELGEQIFFEEQSLSLGSVVRTDSLTLGSGNNKRLVDCHRVAVTTQSGEHILVGVFQDKTAINLLVEHERIRSSCMTEALLSTDIAASMQHLLEHATTFFQADCCLVSCFDHKKQILTPSFEYSNVLSKELVQQITKPEPILIDEYSLIDFDSCRVSSVNMPGIPYHKDDPWLLSSLKGQPYFVTDLLSKSSAAVKQELGSWGELCQEYCVQSALVLGIMQDSQLWGTFNLIYLSRNEHLTPESIAFCQSLVNILQLLLERNASRCQLIQALNKSQEADRTKRFLLASLSDKLNAPLESILSSLQKATSSNLSLNSSKQTLIEARSAGYSLSNILNSLMMFSDLGAYRNNAKTAKVDMPELLKTIFEPYQIKAESKGLEALLQVKTMPLLAIDAKAISYILPHLLDNAIVFTDVGSIKLEAVFMAEDSQTGRLTISVKDTGVGISPEKLEQIKNIPEDIFKNPNYRDYGMGFNVARGIIHAIGGQESLVSTLGQGTVFSFTIANVPYTISLSGSHR